MLKDMHTPGAAVAVVIRPAADNVAKYPGGSIYSSAGELARLAVAVMNGGRLEEGAGPLSHSGWGRV